MKKAIEDASKDSNKNYFMITYDLATGNETILLHFDPLFRYPILFDSHGSQYKGVNRGASNRAFLNIDDLQAHLDAKYGPNTRRSILQVVKENK